MIAGRVILVGALIVGSGLTLHLARAQPVGGKRTELQRHKGNAAELATYIVEKGKPLVALAK